MSKDPTATLRKRRQRAHARGDHSLCAIDRCDQARGADESALPVEGTSLAEATRAFVARLRFDDTDPRTMSAQVAVTLASWLDAGPQPASVVRELNTILQQLAEVPDQSPGPLDQLRARRHQRMLSQLIDEQVARGA